MKTNAILFDLDGTLIDTAPDLDQAVADKIIKNSDKVSEE
jgi:phosphoglycolate phosphatase-like HAD superfamily hydrolase